MKEYFAKIFFTIITISIKYPIYCKYQLFPLLSSSRQITHKVWYVSVFPIRKSPNTAIIKLLSNLPPNKISNSFDPDVILVNYFFFIIFESQ